MRSYQKKYKAVCTKTEDLKFFELNALPVYDNRYIKTKRRTNGDKVYTNFRGLYVPEDGIEYGSFTVISIDFLLVYEKKYYLQVYLDNFAYKRNALRCGSFLEKNIEKSTCVVMIRIVFTFGIQIFL